MSRRLRAGIVAIMAAVLALLVPAAANAAVTWTPTTVPFGDVALDAWPHLEPVTVTATCAEHFGAACPKPGKFTPEPSFAGDTGDFSQTNNCGTGIVGNSKTTGTCKFVVKFDPIQVGARSAEFTLGYNTTEANIRTPVIVPLSGTGTPARPTSKRCKKKGGKRSALSSKKKCKKKGRR